MYTLGKMKEIVPYCPNVPKLKIVLDIGLRIPLCITLCPVLRSLCSAACYIVLLYVMDDAAASAAPYITYYSYYMYVYVQCIGSKAE